ncbi:FIG00554989: hypothetical protein [Cronobacter sakazakii 696]|uniref:Uncharacterized protein n=1 Tax=Cronobacter sakazakii (strain ATCC BAA-894) TaxID=290339 RepID=A7MR23_CROS8|nr:hypothetical protein ESA_00493 [Cronobacter sakazakii ATCC BAA-894]CCK03712.1 FIG00554989: hypothetical protein [Cronobacter sakazakii 701]CCK08291.1 FIG00554989: hypothetical protein [Cronobacter sakazakii 696]
MYFYSFIIPCASGNFMAAARHYRELRRSKAFVYPFIDDSFATIR